MDNNCGCITINVMGGTFRNGMGYILYSPETNTDHKISGFVYHDREVLRGFLTRNRLNDSNMHKRRNHKWGNNIYEIKIVR